MSDVTFDMSNNKMEIHNNQCEPWHVTLVDTGENSMTGGRLLRVRKYLNDEPFCFTYGDGVSNVNIRTLVDFYYKQGLLAVMTAVQPPGRYGSLALEDCMIRRFEEKPRGDGSWINGGFFVLSPKVLDYIENDDTVWERAPLERLAMEGQLCAYKHTGFWYAMDTLKDKIKLEELWQSGQIPWKIWKE